MQRSRLVDHYADEWASRFSLAISMAAGSPARLAAINASLRHYLPAYVHMPLVKAFFWDGNFSAQAASVQYITFDSVEGTPPVPVSEVDEECRALVEEMRRYAERFLRVVQGPASGGSDTARTSPLSRAAPPAVRFLPWTAATSLASAGADAVPPPPAALAVMRADSTGTGGSLDGGGGAGEGDDWDGSGAGHELMEFWLRKTRKPVLAVVLVRAGADGPRQYFRAMNLEVSMPTGSLCSERAAIAAALAADPGLRRRDIRMVAVLSLPKLEHPDPQVRSAYVAAGVAEALGAEIYRGGGAGGGGGGSASGAAILPPLPPRTPPKADAAAARGFFTHPDDAAGRDALNAGAGVLAPGPGLASAAAAATATAAAVSGTPNVPAAVADAPPLLTPAPPRDATVSAGGSGGVHGLMRHRSSLLIATPSADGGSSPHLAPADAFHLHMHVTPESAVAATLTAGRATAEARAAPSLGPPSRLVLAAVAEEAAAEEEEGEREKEGGAKGAGEGGRGTTTVAEGVAHGLARDAAATAASPDVSLHVALPAAVITTPTPTSDVATAASSVAAPDAPPPAARRARGSSGAAAAAAPTHPPPPPLPPVPVALNPLAPCGSCMEWLRKIAEANPDFKVLSFTDVSCARVFIKPVL